MLKIIIISLTISACNFTNYNSPANNHRASTTINYREQPSDFNTNLQAMFASTASGYNKAKAWFNSLFSNNTQPIVITNKKPKTNNLVVSLTVLDVDYVVVNKSNRKMYLKKSGIVIKEYNIALGTEPIGKKTYEGDLKTPEGLYRLGFKNSSSEYYKSVKISYPNLQDRQHAKTIGKPPGGAIVVHGMPNKWNSQELIKERGKDWTEGCIALNNKDMDEFWQLVNKSGMFIKIDP